MKYEFSELQINKAKEVLRKLNRTLRMWQEEKERAISDRKKYADKYYSNIGKRIVYADEQIAMYQERIHEFEAMIKEKSIEI